MLFTKSYNRIDQFLLNEGFVYGSFQKNWMWLGCHAIGAWCHCQVVLLQCYVAHGYLPGNPFDYILRNVCDACLLEWPRRLIWPFSLNHPRAIAAKGEVI